MKMIKAKAQWHTYYNSNIATKNFANSNNEIRKNKNTPFAPIHPIKYCINRAQDEKLAGWILQHD